MKKVKQFIYNNLILISFLVISIVGGLFSGSFFSSGNLFNIMKQSTPILICAMAMLMIIITGGIDLSVGSYVAFLAVAIAKVVLSTNLFIGILVGISLGCMAGLVNGLLITFGRMAPFIATLVTMSSARGLALILSNGETVYLDENPAINLFANEGFLGIPYLMYFALVIVLVFWLLRNKIFWGRFWVAIGSNREAAYYAGINIKIFGMLPYILGGITAAATAFVLIARTGTASPIAAQGFELDVIAAVVIGGASLSGGKGKVFNTLIGALILTIISNLMNLLGIPGYHQQIIKGVLIALAVLSENFLNKNK